MQLISLGDTTKDFVMGDTNDPGGKIIHRTDSGIFYPRDLARVLQDVFRHGPIRYERKNIRIYAVLVRGQEANKLAAFLVVTFPVRPQLARSIRT